MSRTSDVMAKLASKFQPEAAKDLDLIYQIDIEDEGLYHLQINQQECHVHQGEHPDPNVTLYMNAETFEDVIDGTIGGTSAFLSGKIRAEGNIMLATQLSKLFKR